MCIVKSVGQWGRNDITDVLLFQILFNLNIGRFPNPKPAKLDTDGKIGPNTINAIKSFEIKIMNAARSDGMIAPGDAIVAALLAGLAKGPSKEKLSVVMPSALPAKLDLYYEPLVKAMKKYAIRTGRRMAHFIAQIAHESASFRYSEEIADGSAYEGRIDLGNTQPGDGKRFKGRGLIQLTGRANYRSYSEHAGVDYVANPQLVSTDRLVATDVACWFWKKNNINALADKDDVKAVTRTINGGYNGLDDRVEYLFRAKAVLGIK
ncbi:MAG: glycoside hydrolase family 19 protein [Deltaproteobacteria bacterium]|nr:glycoside hydrolase family 19 protein [Deltaproteobacteria bacterium]